MIKTNKILLITSTSGLRTVQDSIAISYGLYLLKHSLNIHGIDCDVCDLELISESQCLDNVKNSTYNIIGMSVTHMNMQADLEFLYALKKTVTESKRKCLFVAGGMSSTLNHDAWLKGGFDVIFLGYAEETLLKVCENYYNNIELNELRSFLRETDGVAFRYENGEIQFNPSKPLSEKVFEHQKYTLAMGMEVPYKEYWDFIRSKGTDALSMNNRSFVIENARLYTSCKCLAKCGYCCTPTFLPASQKTTTTHQLLLSAEQMCNLVIHNVQKYKAMSFSLNDEDFIGGNRIGIKRVINFCDLIITSKKNGEIPEEIRFSCQTRASNFLVREPNNKTTVNIQLIKKMAEAKFHNVSLGIETLSERLLRSPSVNKLGVSINDYHVVLDTMMKYGLFPTINLIVGIPEETPEELIKTIEQAMDYIDKPCQISVSPKMYSFPGAPIYDSKDYPARYKTWENPITKDIIKISDYYIPKDKRIAYLVEHLENNTLLEIEELKKRYKMGKSQIIPRIGIALCTFSVIARYLCHDKLKNRIDNKLDHLLNNIHLSQ